MWNFSSRQRRHCLLVGFQPAILFSSRSQVMLKFVPVSLSLWMCWLSVVPVSSLFSSFISFIVRQKEIFDQSEMKQPGLFFLWDIYLIQQKSLSIFSKISAIHHRIKIYSRLGSKEVQPPRRRQRRAPGFGTRFLQTIRLTWIGFLPRALFWGLVDF